MSGCLYGINDVKGSSDDKEMSGSDTAGREPGKMCRLSDCGTDTAGGIREAFHLPCHAYDQR